MSKIDAPNIEPTAATKEPVRRPPRPRGKYIDFAPRRNGGRPAAPRVRQQVITEVSRPTVHRPRPVAVEPVVEEETIFIEDNTPATEDDTLTSTDETLFPEDGPLAEFNNFETDEDELASSLAGFADEEPTTEAQEDFLSEANSDDYVEEVLSQVSETHTETTVRRSPFLKNYHIEKRPLSSRAPVQEQLPSAEALSPTPRVEYKEEEFERRADSAPDNAEEPVKTPEEKHGSKLGMVLTIACTILLGAGVGVFVYLAFFQ